jgi:hypothetical protein
MISKTLGLPELKRLILVKANIRVISPSDCKIISSAIQKELKKNISETTLKRLFGFAESKHGFSKFTLNTLKEYVQSVTTPTDGYIEHLIHDDFTADIHQIRLNAHRLTSFTLQNIKNRCSVPYDLTISRAFATYDIDFFRNSKYSYTAFISPPGYGKSILLNHLIQQLFLDSNAVFHNDIVVFLTADQLFHNELDESTMEDRLQLKLGLYKSSDLISYFDEQWKTNGTKLIVIIDGFSELAINKNIKSRIFNCITDFITRINQHDSVKLILSMRSTAWSRFNEQIRHAHFYKSKWFPGSYYNLNDNSNVPPLSELEVEQIFHKMSPTDFTKINDTLKLQLKFPFHIQWYYQLKEEYPAFESYTNIVYFEIIARFIQEKIYNSTYATEKVLFCKKLIQLTNYGRKGYTVNKTDLIKEMPVFKNAYNELLTNGILMEETQITSGIPTEFVRFIQPHIFEYFLFTELYDLFNQKIDEKFFTLINHEYIGNQVRFQLLQWAVRLMVKTHKLSDISAVLDLNLNNYELNYLIYFIAENLHYNAKHDPLLIGEIKEQRLHSLMIKKLIHFDFIDSCYSEAVKCLLQITQRESTMLFYHTILSIFDCLSLNQEQITLRLEVIEKFVTARKSWILDPYEIIKVIQLRLNGIEPPKNPAFDQIISHLNGADVATINDPFPAIKTRVNFLMLLLSSLFCDSTQNVIKIVEAITQRYPKLKKGRQALSIYLLCVAAHANARLNPGKKTDQMENILDHIFASSHGSKATLYSHSLYLLVRAEQCRNRKDFENALKYAKECLAIYKRNQIAIRELYVYKLIIEIYSLIGDQSNVNQFTQQKNDLLNEKKVQLPSFS